MWKNLYIKITFLYDVEENKKIISIWIEIILIIGDILKNNHI